MKSIERWWRYCLDFASGHPSLLCLVLSPSIHHRLLLKCTRFKCWSICFWKKMTLISRKNEQWWEIFDAWLMRDDFSRDLKGLSLSGVIVLVLTITEDTCTYPSCLVIQLPIMPCHSCMHLMCNISLKQFIKNYK